MTAETTASRIAPAKLTTPPARNVSAPHLEASPAPTVRALAAHGPSVPTAVVTGTDHGTGRIVAELLSKRGVRVIGFDADAPPPLTPAGPEPGVDGISASAGSARVPALAQVVADHKAGLVIPTLGNELPEIAAARTLVERAGARVMVAGAGPVSVTSDRLFTAAHLHSRDVAVPRYALPREVGSVEGALERFGGPFVAMPRGRWCPRKPLLVLQPADVDWSTMDDSWLLQEALVGEQFSVLAHRPQKGRESRVVRVFHERDRSVVPEISALADGDPDGGAVPLKAPAIEKLALAAIRALGLTGPATVTVRLTPAGTPKVLGVQATYTRHLRLAADLLDAALSGALAP